MADDVVEDPEMYVQLVALAHDVAAAIVETPAGGLSGSTLYIASEARRWADIARPATSAALTGPAADILELLRRNWAELCAGRTYGE